MKRSKIVSFIAGLFFLIAAIQAFTLVQKLRPVLVNGNGGSGNSMFLAPIIELLFALGSFLFGYYIIKQEKKGMTVAHARLISIVLIILSIALSWAVTMWFILLPIYNLS